MSKSDVPNQQATQNQNVGPSAKLASSGKPAPSNGQDSENYTKKSIKVF